MWSKKLTMSMLCVVNLHAQDEQAQDARSFVGDQGWQSSGAVAGAAVGAAPIFATFVQGTLGGETVGETGA